MKVLTSKQNAPKKFLNKVVTKRNHRKHPWFEPNSGSGSSPAQCISEWVSPPSPFRANRRQTKPGEPGIETHRFCDPKGHLAFLTGSGAQEMNRPVGDRVDFFAWKMLRPPRSEGFLSQGVAHFFSQKVAKKNLCLVMLVAQCEPCGCWTQVGFLQGAHRFVYAGGLCWEMTMVPCCGWTTRRSFIY